MAYDCYCRPLDVTLCTAPLVISDKISVYRVLSSLWLSNLLIYTMTKKGTLQDFLSLTVRGTIISRNRGLDKDHVALNTTVD